MPRRSQRFVLGVCQHAVVTELDHAEGVGLAPEVGRGEALGLENFNHQMSNIFHVLKGVGCLLKIIHKNASLKLDLALTFEMDWAMTNSTSTKILFFCAFFQNMLLN